MYKSKLNIKIQHLELFFVPFDNATIVRQNTFRPRIPRGRGVSRIVFGCIFTLMCKIIHKNMHRHSRNYICALANCGKSFKHPGDLASHTRSHCKPHKCAHCDYENPDIRNLKSHQRTHSRAAPFKCKLCGESFVHSNQLLRHRPKCSKNIKPEAEKD